MNISTIGDLTLRRLSLHFMSSLNRIVFGTAFQQWRYSVIGDDPEEVREELSKIQNYMFCGTDKVNINLLFLPFSICPGIRAALPVDGLDFYSHGIHT